MGTPTWQHISLCHTTYSVAISHQNSFSPSLSNSSLCSALQTKQSYIIPQRLQIILRMKIIDISQVSVSGVHLLVLNQFHIDGQCIEKLSVTYLVWSLCSNSILKASVVNDGFIDWEHVSTDLRSHESRDRHKKMLS